MPTAPRRSADAGHRGARRGRFASNPPPYAARSVTRAAFDCVRCGGSLANWEAGSSGLPNQNAAPPVLPIRRISTLDEQSSSGTAAPQSGREMDMRCLIEAVGSISTLRRVIGRRTPTIRPGGTMNAIPIRVCVTPVPAKICFVGARTSRLC